MEFLLLDIADLFFQSSYWILCLTVKNHVVEKTGPCLQLGSSGVLSNDFHGVGIGPLSKILAVK
jgi:hypothetical protein